ncbi:ABC transporter ATP-binding protein [Mycoplasma sp. 1018B]|uniref:ABC transporter ATP-binding protein n=1 Tax=Mycoplasma sp. 1018B TaxID=2967302 RepID=UPI00211C17A5|nr:ABC transporter ATP-binding protein [Mycoplasma sp. 1018B]UUM19393.1 ABC transporter ATP-binding protein/permease [Mycoplasma sp. 1018B]
MINLIKMLPTKLKSLFLLGAFIVLINVFLTLFFPNLISQFIKLIFSQNQNELISIEIFKGLWSFAPAEHNVVFKWLLITVICLIIINITLTFFAVLIIIYASENTSKYLRIKLFEKIQTLSLKNIADLKSETIITCVSNDIAIFWEFLVNGATTLIRGIFLALGSTILAFLVDPNMAWGIMGIIPALCILIGVIAYLAIPLFKKTQLSIESLTKDINENVNGIRVIKTYNLETKRIDQFSLKNLNWYKISFKSEIIFSTAQPVFFMLINSLIVSLYAIAYNAINNNPLDSTTLVNLNVMIDYLYNISFGIMMMVGFLFSFFRAKVSASRINNIFNTKVDNLLRKEGLILDSNYDIEVKNLNFKYYESAEKNALNDINFKLNYKQTLGIIGPTGAGKSTLVNLLVNNYVYNDGSILIGNKELMQLQTKNIHDNVGIVYQEALMYTGTIKSNLLWAKANASQEEMQKALINADAWEFVDKFDKKLDHPVIQGGKNLSGGQKQRLSIARALLRKPKILILDDSTSALDNITTKKVINNIKNNYNCTTILVSQKIAPIRDSDLILVMQDGNILAQGKHNDLIVKCDLYNSIYKNQLDQ